VDVLLVTVVVGLVVMIVSAPLRRVARAETSQGPRLRELEAAREAKYREIRDAELDHRTGKLSDEDYAAVDATLRGEAIEILRALDTISGR
jgi:type II secretory pathway component PulM